MFSEKFNVNPESDKTPYASDLEEMDFDKIQEQNAQKEADANSAIEPERSIELINQDIEFLNGAEFQQELRDKIQPFIEGNPAEYANKIKEARETISHLEIPEFYFDNGNYLSFLELENNLQRSISQEEYKAYTLLCDQVTLQEIDNYYDDCEKFGVPNFERPLRGDPLRNVGLASKLARTASNSYAFIDDCAFLRCSFNIDSMHAKNGQLQEQIENYFQSAKDNNSFFKTAQAQFYSGDIARRQDEARQRIEEQGGLTDERKESPGFKAPLSFAQWQSEKTNYPSGELGQNYNEYLHEIDCHNGQDFLIRLSLDKDVEACSYIEALQDCPGLLSAIAQNIATNTHYNLNPQAFEYSEKETLDALKNARYQDYRNAATSQIEQQYAAERIANPAAEREAKLYYKEGLKSIDVAHTIIKSVKSAFPCMKQLNLVAPRESISDDSLGFFDSQTGTIALNSTNLSENAMRMQDNSLYLSGYNCQGNICAAVYATLTHECGHAIDYTYNLSERARAIANIYGLSPESAKMLLTEAQEFDFTENYKRESDINFACADYDSSDMNSIDYRMYFEQAGEHLAERISAIAGAMAETKVNFLMDHRTTLQDGFPGNSEIYAGIINNRKIKLSTAEDADGPAQQIPEGDYYIDGAFKIGDDLNLVDENGNTFVIPEVAHISQSFDESQNFARRLFIYSSLEGSYEIQFEKGLRPEEQIDSTSLLNMARSYAYTHGFTPLPDQNAWQYKIKLTSLEADGYSELYHSDNYNALRVEKSGTMLLTVGANYDQYDIQFLPNADSELSPEELQEISENLTQQFVLLKRGDMPIFIRGDQRFTLGEDASQSFTQS